MSGATLRDDRGHRVSARFAALTFALGMLGLLVASQLALSGVPLLSDELTHRAQIDAFLRGEWTQHPHLTTFATYHWIMASALDATGSDSIVALRWLSGLVGVLLLAWLAWRTLLIPNTQSATGILYAAVILVFMGELSSQFLSIGTPYQL